MIPKQMWPMMAQIVANTPDGAKTRHIERASKGELVANTSSDEKYADVMTRFNERRFVEEERRIFTVSTEAEGTFTATCLNPPGRESASASGATAFQALRALFQDASLATTFTDEELTTLQPFIDNGDAASLASLDDGLQTRPLVRELVITWLLGASEGGAATGTIQSAARKLAQWADPQVHQALYVRSLMNANNRPKLGDKSSGGQAILGHELSQAMRKAGLKSPLPEAGRAARALLDRVCVLIPGHAAESHFHIIHQLRAQLALDWDAARPPLQGRPKEYDFDTMCEKALPRRVTDQVEISALLSVGLNRLHEPASRVGVTNLLRDLGVTVDGSLIEALGVPSPERMKEKAEEIAELLLGLGNATLFDPQSNILHLCEDGGMPTTTLLDALRLASMGRTDLDVMVFGDNLLPSTIGKALDEAISAENMQWILGAMMPSIAQLEGVWDRLSDEARVIARAAETVTAPPEPESPMDRYLVGNYTTLLRDRSLPDSDDVGTAYQPLRQTHRCYFFASGYHNGPEGYLAWAERFIDWHQDGEISQSDHTNSLASQLRDSFDQTQGQEPADRVRAVAEQAARFGIVSQDTHPMTQEFVGCILRFLPAGTLNELALDDEVTAYAREIVR